MTQDECVQMETWLMCQYSLCKPCQSLLNVQRGTFNCNSIINLNIMHLRSDWEWMLGVRYKQNRDGVSWALSTQLRPFWRGKSIEKVMCEANLMIVVSPAEWEEINKHFPVYYIIAEHMPSQVELDFFQVHSTSPTWLSQTHILVCAALWCSPSSVVIHFTSGHLSILFWHVRKICHPKTWERICIIEPNLVGV